MASSVNISVEAPIENQIQEITYDGQEIYQAYVIFFPASYICVIISCTSIKLQINEFLRALLNLIVSANTIYVLTDRLRCPRTWRRSRKKLTSVKLTEMMSKRSLKVERRPRKTQKILHLSSLLYGPGTTSEIN